jgi:hypothetical protein
LITGVSSCMSFVVEGSGDRDKSTNAQSVQETVHGSFWGSLWDRPYVSKCEKGQELYRIKYHQNAVFVLASIATLGLYVPQAVEWWCVAREDPGADEGGTLKLKKRTPGQG